MRLLLLAAALAAFARPAQAQVRLGASVGTAEFDALWLDARAAVPVGPALVGDRPTEAGGRLGVVLVSGSTAIVPEATVTVYPLPSAGAAFVPYVMPHVGYVAVSGGGDVTGGVELGARFPAAPLGLGAFLDIRRGGIVVGATASF